MNYRNIIPFKCGWKPRPKTSGMHRPCPSWLHLNDAIMLAVLAILLKRIHESLWFPLNRYHNSASNHFWLSGYWTKLGILSFPALPYSDRANIYPWGLVSCHSGAEFGCFLVCFLQDVNVGWPSVQCVSLPAPLQLSTGHQTFRLVYFSMCSVFCVYWCDSLQRESNKNVKKTTFKAVKSC